MSKKPLTQQSTPQLQSYIRETAKDTSNIFFTAHVRKRMRERKITDACVLETLRKGSIKRQPEPNISKGSLECKMEHFCSGQSVGVVVAVSDDDPTLILVTAI